MMAEEGRKVTINFVCRLEDGTIYDIADRDTLQFVVGEGNTLPSLEMGVLGMHPGEHRTIRVPASEVEDFPFLPDGAPNEADFPAGIGAGGTGYDFEPGDDGGDVLLTSIPGLQAGHQSPPAASDLIFDVEMVEVEHAEVALEE